MHGVVYLKANEIVAARPFTHPEHISHDYKTLRYMLTQLCLLLEYPRPIPHTVLFTRPNDGDWFHRLVLPQPEQLRHQKPLTVVGFFGQRRENADRASIRDFEKNLLDEIVEHAGLLSYSSMALTNGDYGNLVLFANREARDYWSTSQAHAQAVNVLSPSYYWSVRIYNGRLPGGITNNSDLSLTRVKYYDYRSQPMWRAVREIKESEFNS